MNTFIIELQSPVSGCEKFADVISFKGRDSSGSFGILANAEKRITVLSFGLASFQKKTGSKEYLAIPGGVLYFENNFLHIATQNYFHSASYSEITNALETKILTAESEIQKTKQSLRRLDQEILKRLTQLNWRTLR